MELVISGCRECIFRNVLYCVLHKKSLFEKDSTYVSDNLRPPFCKVFKVIIIEE